MSAISDAQRAFYLATGLVPAAVLDDAVIEAFVAGGDHEAAHLLKHLEAYLLDAKDAELTVASEWKTRIDADTTSRITRVLADG